MKHLFSLLFIFYFVLGQSQTTIPIVGFKGTINTFPTVSNDTITTTVTLLDISNQFTGNNLTGRDSLVLWKNCKRYRVDTIMTAFATSVTLKLLKEGNPNLTPGVCAFIEETVGNKSFAPAGITDGERQCINAYYAGNDSLSILDTIFINDSLYYVLNGDTINAGYVNTTPTKVKDTPTMKLRIVSDTIRADIKKRLNSGNVGGIDKWSYIEFDSTGQITLVSTTLNDDFDKDPYNEFQNLTIDSVGRRFTLGITDGNEVSFIDQVGASSLFMDQDSLYYVVGSDTFNLGINISCDDLKTITYTGGAYFYPALNRSKCGDFGYGFRSQYVTNDTWSLHYFDGSTWSLIYEDGDNDSENEGAIVFDGFSTYRRASFRSNTNLLQRRDIVSDSTIFIYNDPSGIIKMGIDTNYLGNVISDSLSAYTFVTDTALIETIVTNSLDTLTLPIDSTIVLGGTGITAWESPANTWNIQNDDPDQTVTLTPTGIISISGAYPNFTIGATEVDGDPNNEKQTLSQSFTGTTEATYSLNLSGGSVKDTTGYMRLETMSSTAGQRGYRYKSNLGAIMGLYEDPSLSGFSNIEILRTGNLMSFGLRTDNATSGKIYKFNGTRWALADDNVGTGTVTSVGLGLGTSGTDANVSGSPITSSGSFTLNLPTASASNRGLLSAANWTTFNNKVGGSGTNGYIPLWNGTSTQTNSIMVQNGNGIGVGGSPTYYFDVLASAYGSYGARIYNQGIGNRNGLLIKSDESNVGRYPFKIESTGAPNAFTVNADGTVGIGVATTTNSVFHLYAGVARARLESSTTNARCEFNFVNSSKNYSFGINPDGGSANFFALYDNTAGKYPFYVDPTNNTVVINRVFGSYASKALNVNGGVQVQDLVGSGNRLVYADGTGILNTAVIGTGLSLSSGTLNATATGTVTGTGTTNAIPYWTSSTALGSMPITYSTVLPAMVVPTGNAIHLVGTSTIIDKNNSYGAVGEILSKASGGGVDWIPFDGTDLAFTTKSGTDVPLVSSTGPGTSPKFRDGTNILLTQVSSSVMSVNTDVSYGYMNTTATTQSMTAGSSYKIALTNEINNGVVTASNANDRFTVSATGIYEIHYDLGFAYTSGSSSNILELSVQKNGTGSPITGTTSQSFSTASATPVNTSRTVIASLNATDYIELFAQMASGTISVTYNFGNFSIKRID